jgi:methionyl-tRNA formyltransferase
MRVVFFGTPAFAVPSLEALQRAGVEVIAVVTQPDRPRGRSHSTLLPCPVKAAAVAAGLPVFTPENPRDPEFMAALTALAPDLGVVVAYGHLLRPALLAIPRLGLVNVHASILPRWRGAAPIHWAIKAGDAETGVSIMRVEQGLDSGGVWHIRRTPIDPTDTTGMLFDRLAHLGAEALIEALPRIAAGEEPVAQDPAGVTHAPKVTRDNARVDWHQPAEVVDAQIRAMDPAPGAWTTEGGRAIKLFGVKNETDIPSSRAERGTSAPADNSNSGVPGCGNDRGPTLRSGRGAPDPRSPFTVHDGTAPGTIAMQSGIVMVACADAFIPLGDVTPAGGKRQSALSWYRGAQLPDGVVFE